jgi:hypothetical protein
MEPRAVILDEFDTIRAVLSGKSLARFGDGELKVMHGAGYSREPAYAELTAQLVQTFLAPHPDCLIGIPTWDARGPKYQNWLRHRDRFNKLIQPKTLYASAFVTRPDSAPWINSREYAQAVERIWKGKRVVVVCEKQGSMVKTVALAAAEVKHLACPHQEAFASIDKLEGKTLAHAPDVAILCAGPTASILANRLAAKGVQAVDLGSAGQFLGRLLA